MTCPCIQNEEGETIVFCRDCGMNLEQGSVEWRRARVGKLGASRFQDAIARTKTGWGASRANYRAELVCERISGIPYEGYRNGYMDRGNQIEPDAVTAYEYQMDIEAQTCGFCLHPEIPMAGASPDRLIGDVGMIEAKCRTTAIHFDLLLRQVIPERNHTQIQFQLACRPERLWCDFVSFDPRAPERYQLLVKRIYRDGRRIAELEQMGREFLVEVEQMTAELQSRVAKSFVFIGGPEVDLTADLEASIASSRSKKEKEK